MRIACRGADEEAWKADCGDPHDTSHPVLDTKAPVVVPNIQAATHALQSGYFHRHGYVSYLGVPLLAKELPKEYLELLEARQALGRRLSVLPEVRYRSYEPEFATAFTPEDLAELPAEVKNGMEFVPVENLEQALKVALPAPISKG